MFQDLRYGARKLLKNPGFTLIAVLTLALGIGAVAAIFSVVDAILWRPLPAHRPERLVALYTSAGDGAGYRPLSYTDYSYYRDNQKSFQGLAAYVRVPLNWREGDRVERIGSELVAGSFFGVLGLQAADGRLFTVEDDRTLGAHPVAVISHRLWLRRFKSDPGVIGRTLNLNNYDYTIIGVAPAGYSSPLLDWGKQPDVWLPMMMQPQALPRGGDIDVLRDRDARWLMVIGRLKDGINFTQAETEIRTLAARIETAWPRHNAGRKGILLPASQARFWPEYRREITRLLTMLGVLAALVLLVACFNVANLLLARAAGRRKETGIRLALGAGRWRLARQWLTEGLLLALLGAGAGLLLAQWLNQLLLAFKPPFPPPQTFTLDLPLDARALGFTLLLAVVTGVGFGLIPALQASKPDVIPSLKDESGSEGGRRRWFNLRNALVVAQVALSLVLLLGAGLFIRSLQRARSFDLGFKPDNVLTFSFNLQLQGYDEARGREFFPRIVERLERLPGVQAVSTVNFLPLGFMARGSPVAPDGRDLPPRERPVAGYFAVGLRYFETIGTPLLRGRDFTPQDTATAPSVAIISEGLARRLWPNEDALGKRLRLMGGPNEPSSEIVGIAGDAKNLIFRSLDQPAPPVLYRPFAQSYSARMSLVVRTSGDPQRLIPAVRREVAALDEDLPPHEMQPLAENVALALWSSRTGAGVLSIFGLLGLALAAIGIYGVMSYAVAARTREIGVRMALGAQARDVLKLVVGQGLALTLIGTVIGLTLAFAVTRLLASFLYGVSATDAVTFAGVSFFLIGVALAACYLPARRATKVDPLASLRHE